MTVTNLKRLEQSFITSHGKITADDAKKLIDSAKDYGGVSAAEKAELKAVIAKYADKLEPAAKDTLEKYLNITPAGPGGNQPPNMDVVKSVTGTNPGSFQDDTIFLGKDGTVSSKAGVESYTRSYDSTKEGPLRTAHGSAAPPSTLISKTDADTLAKQTPGQALDKMAAAFGAGTQSFDKLAGSKQFYDDKADYWWGKCHAWTWSSLSNKIDKKVDVEGPDGQKGVWLAGQWMSRADLGNWMMATADSISVDSPNTMFKQNLSADDLLKGSNQFMMNNGGGVIADIFNDKKHGHQEVWNQPFVGADMTTKTVSGDAAKAILDQAKKDGVAGGVTVKQVDISGKYGVEQSDDYEGDPGRTEKNWKMYSVTDNNGKVLKSYMADDDALKNVNGIDKNTDEVPDYLWKPKLDAIDDTLDGKPNSTVDGDALGKEFKFFVGTVLNKAVSGAERNQFEAEFKALPAGAVSPDKAKALADKYQGVANAYSPQQWKDIFQSRGLDAKAFGASWKPV